MGYFKQLNFKDLKLKFYEILNLNRNEYKNKEIVILFIRITMFIFNFYILFNIMGLHIIASILICRYINVFFWDYLTAWNIGDYIRGYLIYRESMIIDKKNYIYMSTIIDLYNFIVVKYTEFKFNEKNKKPIKLEKYKYIILFYKKLYTLLLKLSILLVNTINEKNWNKFNIKQNYCINFLLSIYQYINSSVDTIIDFIVILLIRFYLNLINFIISILNYLYVYLIKGITYIQFKEIKQLYIYIEDLNILIYGKILFFKKYLIIVDKPINLLLDKIIVINIFLKDIFFKKNIIGVCISIKKILINTISHVNTIRFSPYLDYFKYFLTRKIIYIAYLFYRLGLSLKNNMFIVNTNFVYIFFFFFKKFIYIIIYIYIIMDLILSIKLYIYVIRYVYYILDSIKIKLSIVYCRFLFKKVIIRDRTNITLDDSICNYVKNKVNEIYDYSMSTIAIVFKNLFKYTIYFCKETLNYISTICMIKKQKLIIVSGWLNSNYPLIYNYIKKKYNIFYSNILNQNNFKQKIVVIIGYLSQKNINIYIYRLWLYIIHNITNIINKLIIIYIKSILSVLCFNYIFYLSVFIENLNYYRKVIYNDYIIRVYNYLYNVNWSMVFLELRIYYVNRKRPWKQFKFDKSLYIIKYLDYLEYSMITHKKLYKGVKIIKFHKKKYRVKKIPSLIEKIIKDYKIIIKKEFNVYMGILYIKTERIVSIKKYINYNIFNYNFYNINIFRRNYLYYILHVILNKVFILILDRLVVKYENKITVYVYRLYNIFVSKLNLNYSFFNKPINAALYIVVFFTELKYDYNYYKKIIINIYYIYKDIMFDKQLNYFSLKKNKKFYISIYLPFLVIDYIISDFCVSITIFKNYYRRKKKIKKIINFFKKIIISIIKFIGKSLFRFKIKFKKLFYNHVIINIYYVFSLLLSKNIYILFLCSYFYNYTITYITNKYYVSTHIYGDDLYIYLINYFFYNRNVLQLFVTIIGLLLTLKGAKIAHKIYGNYLWTMTVFVIFLESHKIFYLKIFLLNFLDFYTIESDFIFKLNLFEYLNFKLFNIYFFFYILLLLLFLVYVTRHGCFMVVYAHLRAPRWFFIKYPLIILLLETFRFKLIELVSIYILYIINKYHIYIYILDIHGYIKNNVYIIDLLTLFKNYIYNYDNISLSYFIYLILIPNVYLINIILDIIIVYVCLIWITRYSKQYLKSDKKYVAFPVVACEFIIKYIIYIYILYYSYILWLILISDGKIIYYGFYTLVCTYLYLEFRVHKIPRKTVSWYFRQIVDLWPTTSLNVWTNTDYLRFDQKKYIAMRFKFKHCKIAYSNEYYKNEFWEMSVISSFQREKEYYLYIFSAFSRLMYRKEGMLREFNIFDYQGWQLDWEYNYKKIKIYKWKLDWWNKFHVNYMDKFLVYSGLRFYYIDYQLILYRISCKYSIITFNFWLINFLDFIYTNKYLFENEHLKWKYDSLYYDDEDPYNIWLEGFFSVKHKLFYRSRKYKGLCREWKKKNRKKGNRIKELRTLKKLKRILMEFSSGEREKPHDWKFPWIFEKQYSEEGWKMFENPDIDAASLDWRPVFEEW